MLKQSYYAAMSAFARIQDNHPLGTPIWRDDWDVCIILDSCRADLLADEWGDINTHWSAGSVTTEWLANTFHRDRDFNPASLGFVSATPHSNTVFRQRSVLTNQDTVRAPFPPANTVAPSEFDGFYELWRQYATVKNAVPPTTACDATIEAYDRHEKVVAHWLQPHEPFIAPDARMVGGAATDSNVWDGLQQGTLAKSDVWQAYRANLQHALTQLKRLLRSIDGTVLVTADHGNAFGEWGVYGHPYGWPQPAVRKVPWVVRDAVKEQETVSRGVLDGLESGGVDVGDQLKALGYR